MTQLVLQPTATAQWHDLVNEAQQAAHCQLDEALESYLVFLLERFSRRPNMLSRIIANDFLQASNLACSQAGQQHEQLRDIGDHCLLFSGLFPQIAERRLVKISYFVSLGRNAYSQIAGHNQRGGELYTDLSLGFVQLMDVLHTIRRLGNKQDEQMMPLQAYDLWQDTGSQQAYELLCTLSDTATPLNLDLSQSPLH